MDDEAQLEDAALTLKLEVLSHEPKIAGTSRNWKGQKWILPGTQKELPRAYVFVVFSQF